MYSVIIPSRNETNLRACVSAIRAAGETCRIIVVDDGMCGDVLTVENLKSAIGVAQDAEQWHPLVIVRGQKPFIFSRNVNIGIRAAGEDDVILLNDDALLKTPMGFEKLRPWSALRPDIGILSPVTNNIGNPLQVGKLQNISGPIKIEPRTLAFVCVYIPRSTIDTVGLLDERFVDYGMEDSDYCMRVLNAGLKLGVYDGCFLDHQRLPSEFGSQGRRDYKANMRRFIEKWGCDNYGNTRPGPACTYKECFPKEKGARNRCES